MEKVKKIYLFLISILVIFVLCKCSSTPENPTEKAIKDINSDIEKVEIVKMGNNTYNLDIYYAPSFILSEGTFLFQTSDNLMKISKEIIQNWGNKIKEIVYWIKVPVVDKYGNKSKEVVLRLYYKGNELKKVNWDNFDNWSFLNLTDRIDIISPIGKDLIIAFCKQKDNLEYSTTFCMKALHIY